MHNYMQVERWSGSKPGLSDERARMFTQGGAAREGDPSYVVINIIWSYENIRNYAMQMMKILDYQRRIMMNPYVPIMQSIWDFEERWSAIFTIPACLNWTWRQLSSVAGRAWGPADYNCRPWQGMC